ncbi:MAG: N-acetylmuramoyl-L-alanine amidase [Capnocytophaga sp.]|nr:N-acetylmuramoyl-L-alanine amidase [Capnocytophaga sp.]
MKRRPQRYLVIHCTATPEGREVTADDIRRWHLRPKPQGRGWKQVGYTDMIHLNGAEERLVGNNDDAWVDAWEITNGVAGINSVAKHVVYVGGTDKDMKPKDTRTPAQRATLAKYVKKAIARNPDVLIAGHCQFAAKACPSFDVPKWLRSIGIAEKNIYKN